MIRAFLRWLWTGSVRPAEAPNLCDFCVNDYHVHDDNSGRCITAGCECGGNQ